MTQRSVVHATFVIDRTYSASREKVFSAFADFETKKKWFGGGGPGIHWSMDFRVGGREHSEGEVEVHGARHHSRFDSIYLDIVPDQRIVYAYDMDVNGDHVSASLTTIEFLDAAGGTRLKFTEQGAFLDGFEDPKIRENGTRGLLDLLGEAVAG